MYNNVEQVQAMENYYLNNTKSIHSCFLHFTNQHALYTAFNQLMITQFTQHPTNNVNHFPRPGLRVGITYGAVTPEGCKNQIKILGVTLEKNIYIGLVSEMDTQKEAYADNHKVLC